METAESSSDGGLDNNDFKSSPKPEKLEAESAREMILSSFGEMISTGARITSKSTKFSTKKLEVPALTGSVTIQCVVTKLTKGLPYLGLIPVQERVPSMCSGTDCGQPIQ